MEYGHNTFSFDGNFLRSLLGDYLDWSNKNITGTAQESEFAEDFVFLCEMGIVPDLTITNSRITKEIK